jgi:hypothetical protein
MDGPWDDDMISTGRPLGAGIRSETRHYFSPQDQESHHHDSTSSGHLHDMNHPSIMGSLSTFVFNLATWILDYITGPNFGVFVAVLVIFGFQFRTNLQDLYITITEDGLKQTLLDLVFNSIEISRAYFQIVCELLRSFRQYYFFDGNADNGCPYPNDGHHHANLAQQSYNNNINNRKGRNSMLLRGNPAHYLLSSSYGPPPPLVVVDDRGQIMSSEGGQDNYRSLSPTISTSSMSTNSWSINTHAIEPAFLNERDYPKGWLVYHPMLGVVSKEEADEYDEHQQLQQPEQARQHQNLEESQQEVNNIAAVDDTTPQASFVQTRPPASDHAVLKASAAAYGSDSDRPLRKSTSATATSSNQISLSLQNALDPPATAAVNG